MAKLTPTFEFQQPRGLYILSFAELCERFSYYGLLSILVLYAAKIFALSDSQSFTLFGGYASFSYAMPVLGGFLADRWIGFRKAIIIGALLLILSYLLLAIPNLHFFIIGLAVNVCGIGLYKPNTTALVGTLYTKSDPHRDGGYTWFYTSMNIGATIGAIIYGIAVEFLGWTYEYFISAISITLALVIFVRGLKYFPAKQSLVKIALIENLKLFINENLLLGITITLLVFILCLLFFYPIFLADFITIFIVSVILILIFNTRKYQISERNHVFALLILAFFGMCFFAASFQVGSSLNLFIQRNVNHTIFHWQIPTVMFASLYPLAVVIMAPMITTLWGYLAVHQREPSAISKLIIGLILATIGFLCFMQAAIAANKNSANLSPLLWIVLGNLFLGAGELSLTPAIFSSISRIAPKRLQGTFMGIWFLFVAFGGYFSGVLAKMSEQAISVSTSMSTLIYFHGFAKIALVVFIIALFLFLLSPSIKKLMS